MKIIATNKKASYDYNISLKLDAGMILTGSEVKSLRINSPSIKGSYVDNIKNELWLCNCFIKKYESSSEKDINTLKATGMITVLMDDEGPVIDYFIGSLNLTQAYVLMDQLKGVIMDKLSGENV